MAQYLSATEAMEALHLPPSTFYRYVRERKIKKHYPTPMSKHGKYDAVEIARLKKRIRLEEHPPETGETDWIKASDLGHFYNLEYSIYGDETGDSAIIRRWLTKNPYITRILFKKGDRRELWGGISLNPLREETIFRILKGEIKDTDINLETDLLTYDEPGVYNIYVGSVIIRPERIMHFKTLLESIFDFWCNMAPERKFGRIYGRAVTTDGEKLIKHLFFSPLYDISENAWMLDVRRPNPANLVQSFQECVREKGEVDTP
jgi:hypothetical protein